jgi:putative ATP-dependent endonuclease of the OLD family
MHRLAAIAITNFRSCRDVQLALDDCTPIVGYNNAGKSNIIRAIEWVLAPRPLAAGDFFDPNIPVRVEATVTGLTTALLDLLNESHRRKIAPFISDNQLRFCLTQTTPGCKKNEIQQEIHDPTATKEEDRWKPNPSGIFEAIKKLFPEPITIGAMEDVAEDSTKAKSGTTISKLLAEFTEPVVQAHGADIASDLHKIRQRLSAYGEERAAQLQRFDREASAALQHFFPGLQLHLDIPVPDIGALFKAGTIRISERERSGIRDFTELGHGAQRSIQMALIRYLADLRSLSGRSPQRRLLLIEEPELFLHPQAIEQIRQALETLSQERYQVIFATHSPLMIARKSIPRTRIIRKDGQYGETRVLVSLEDALTKRVDEEDKRLHVLFDLKHASGWLFSDRVLLAEGKTEQALLPALYEAATGQTLADHRLSVVTLGGSEAIHAALKVFAEIGIEARALVDFDYALTQGVKHGLIQETDAHLCACLGQIKDMAATDTAIKLNEKGRPTNKGTKRAAMVYQEWAQTSDAKLTVQALQDTLKAHGIWLWPGGDIEHHLGLPGQKEPAIWAEFLQRLETNPIHHVVADHVTIEAFVSWLQAAPTQAGVAE